MAGKKKRSAALKRFTSKCKRNWKKVPAKRKTKGAYRRFQKNKCNGLPRRK